MPETTYKTTRSQTLITLLMILCFVFILSLVGKIGLAKIEEHSRLQVRDTLQTVLRSTHETMYVWLENRLNQLTELSSHSELINLVEAQLAKPRDSESLRGTPELAKLRRFLDPILKENGDLGVFIIAPDHVNIASMRNLNIGEHSVIAKRRASILKLVFAGESHFIPPISSNVFLKDKTGRIVENLPTMFITAPIRDNNRNVIAVIALWLDPSQDFTRITQIGRLGKTGETYAIDKSGIFISESRFDEQLRNAGHLGPFQKTILNIRVSDPGVDLTKGLISPPPQGEQPLTVMAQRATAGHAGFNVDGYRNYRGIEVLGAWVWDEKLRFAMATEMEVKEALTPYYATRTVIVSILLVTLLLVVGLVSLLIFLARKSNQNQHLLNRRLDERVRERTLELEDAKAKLSVANRELQELATIDSLTGLSNRRQLDEFLEGEWNRCMRDGKPISFVLFDIDYFKLYNDHYGHLAGDECLQRIGAALLDEQFISRPGDLIARYGGEEFAIVLSGTNKEDAFFIMNKLIKIIAHANLPHEATEVPNCNRVTISAGLATIVPNQTLKPVKLINLADTALYQAKENGRNQYQFTTLQETLTTE